MTATKNGRPPTAAELSKYAQCVFEPGDIVEVCMLATGEVPHLFWCKASELPNRAGQLASENRNGRNIYVGVNPRKEEGGGSEEDVALARCLFVDWDGGTTPDQARERWTAAGLPEPTLVLTSGHGTHAYWRLAEPITDLALWRRLQQSLIAVVGSDPGIHDPPRIMRLPGLLNVKKEPFIPCEIVEADPDQLVNVEAMPLAAEPEAKAEPAAQPSANGSAHGNRPGDEFNKTATWESILFPHGWAIDHAAGGKTYWRRPGKDDGLSATTGCQSAQGNDLLIVFSTNAGPLSPTAGESHARHSKFDAFAKLNHQGDFTAAAKALANQGYGEPSRNGAAQSHEAQDTLPAIVVDTEEQRIANQGIAVLEIGSGVYQRGGCLVHVVADDWQPRGVTRPPDAPRIALLPKPILREILATRAKWVRKTQEGMEPCHPPSWAVAAIDARGQWRGIPHLEAITESPALRYDGTILQTPGYDQASCLLYRPFGQFPTVPESPTRDDAFRCCRELLEIVEDFPFAEETHRAAWLASLLTPLARHAFAGPAPLFLIDANTRGCGKGLLADATGITICGRGFARMTAPKDDEEARKRITALAMAGEPLILLDNIAGSLGSASIDAALTGETWTDRVLGETKMVTAPLLATWYATGNNVVLAADTARRVLHIRLESPLEKPEERSGFRHANLLAWVREQRPRLVAAALTILRGYCLSGRPDPGLTPWGSFEGWSALVRGAVVWLGLPDPGETRQQLADVSDSEANSLRQLLTGWREMDTTGEGLVVAEVLRSLEKHPDEYKALRSAVCEMLSTKGNTLPSARSLGMKLHHLRRRVVGGRYIDRQTRHGTAVWSVLET